MEVSFPYNLQEVENAADKILEFIKDKNLILFSGEMGSGKTTLIKALTKKLEVLDEVTSPTFSVVNEYRTTKGLIIYHFDLYRLNDITEAENLGLSEYFNSDNLCIIEWPEIIINYLNCPYFHITISYLDSLTRELKILIKN